MTKTNSVLIGVLFTGLLCVPTLAAPPKLEPQPLPEKPGRFFVLDNYDYKVTRNDTGFNFFSGNMGEINNPEPGAGQKSIITTRLMPFSSTGAGGCLRIAFDFAGYPASAFGGGFISLFGLTDTLVDLTGSGQQPSGTTRFPGHYLDFDNLFGAFRPWKGRSLDKLSMDLRLAKDSAPVTVKVELKDDAGGDVFARVRLTGPAWSRLYLMRSAFNRASRGSPASFRWDRVKTLSVLVERSHVADGVFNPVAGGFMIDDIRLWDLDGLYPNLKAARDNDGTLKPEYERAFLDYLRKLTFLYFLDFASTDPRTGGLIQDRGTFADLMSVGGGGFQLTAYVIGAKRGYLTRADSAARVDRLLTRLAALPQGTNRVGTTGYQGFYYHFMGIDGLRKQNFDFTATPDTIESRNTVELSSIDTALLLMGVITAKQYFDRDTESETHLRKMAKRIVGRVNWPFMRATLPGGVQQVYLGWKPKEKRDPAQGRFLLPDGLGTGFYSSKSTTADGEQPATLDYYTDEALMIALLGMAAPNPSNRLTRAVWDGLIRDGAGFVKSYPGALFTYQFMSCWVDLAGLGVDNHPTRPTDFFANTRQAIEATRLYATNDPAAGTSLGPDAWGLSACEGPFDAYEASAAPTAALTGYRPLDTGTLTLYGEGCSILHLPAESMAALWQAANLDLNNDGTPDLLHPRFGFADAYNVEISDAVSAPGDGNVLRKAGPWLNPTGFSIDQGPLLIMLDNYLGGSFVPALFMSDPDIQRALNEVFN